MVLHGGWLIIFIIAVIVTVQLFARDFLGMDVFISIAAFAAVVSFIVFTISKVNSEPPATEARKLVVQTVKNVLHKGSFVPFVVPLTLNQALLWSVWLIIVFYYKMFLAVARNRLKAVPSATNVRVDGAFDIYFNLLMNLAVNICWMGIEMMNQPSEPLSEPFFLIFYEPISIVFHTLHVILDHGFQQHVIRPYVGFILHNMAMLMSVGHYVHIWHLHGMTFHLFDAMLFIFMLDCRYGVNMELFDRV